MRPKKRKTNLTGIDISITAIDAIVQGFGNPVAGLTSAAKGISDMKAYGRLERRIDNVQGAMHTLLEEIHNEIQRSTQRDYDMQNINSDLDDKILRLMNAISSGESVDTTTIDRLYTFQERNRAILFPTLFPMGLENLLKDPLFGPSARPFTDTYEFDPKKLNIVSSHEGESVVYSLELGHLALLLKEIESSETTHQLLPVSAAKSDLIIKKQPSISRTSILDRIKYFFLGNGMNSLPPARAHLQSRSGPAATSPHLEEVASIAIPSDYMSLTFSYSGDLLFMNQGSTGDIYMYEFDQESASLHESGVYSTKGKWRAKVWSLNMMQDHPTEDILICKGSPNTRIYTEYIVGLSYRDRKIKQLFEKKIHSKSRSLSLCPNGTFVTYVEEPSREKNLERGRVMISLLDMHTGRLSDSQLLLQPEKGIQVWGADFTVEGDFLAVQKSRWGTRHWAFHKFEDGEISLEPAYCLEIGPRSTTTPRNIFGKHLALRAYESGNYSSSKLIIYDWSKPHSKPIIENPSLTTGEWREFCLTESGEYLAAIKDQELTIYKLHK